ncbi:MAG: hypothetical protein ACI4SR_09980 [Faecalibacillus sp.]
MEFQYNNLEYSYEINASTGAIEKEIDHDKDDDHHDDHDN